MITIMIVVPPNAPPGHPLVCRLPNGMAHSTVVPAGAAPGSRVSFTVRMTSDGPVKHSPPQLQARPSAAAQAARVAMQVAPPHAPMVGAAQSSSASAPAQASASTPAQAGSSADAAREAAVWLLPIAATPWGPPSDGAAPSLETLYQEAQQHLAWAEDRFAGRPTDPPHTQVKEATVDLQAAVESLPMEIKVNLQISLLQLSRTASLLVPRMMYEWMQQRHRQRHAEPPLSLTDIEWVD